MSGFRVALDDIGAIPAEQYVPLVALCGCGYQFVERHDTRDGPYWALEVKGKRCSKHSSLSVYDASVAVLSQEASR